MCREALPASQAEFEAVARNQQARRQIPFVGQKLGDFSAGAILIEDQPQAVLVPRLDLAVHQHALGAGGRIVPGPIGHPRETLFSLARLRQQTSRSRPKRNSGPPNTLSPEKPLVLGTPLSLSVSLTPASGWFTGGTRPGESP